MTICKSTLPVHLTAWILLGSLLVIGPGAATAFDSLFVEEAIVTGDFGGLPDQEANGPFFGYDVAIDGNWMAVGAPATRFHGGSYGLENHGAVFLFKRVDSQWQYIQRILHPAWMDHSLGCGSVALAVPHLVVGCPFADELNNPSVRSGIARWYQLDPTSDTWQLDSGYHGPAGGFCGLGVAISPVHADGSVVLAIGCPGHPLALGSVVIYSYDPVNDEWSGPLFVQASDGEESDSFGNSLSLWRSRTGPISQKLAVGAPFKTHGSAGQSGSVYLFEGANWDESGSVAHPFPHLNGEAYFGSDVAINETQLVVGAEGGRSAECPDPPRCGLVRHYVLDGSLPINLVDDGPAVNDRGNPPGQQDGMQFGARVALGPRNWIAVTAPQADGFTHNNQLAEDTGVVELRRAENGSYGVSIDDYFAEIRPDPLELEALSGGRFGFGLDFSQSHLAVGAPQAGGPAGPFGEVRIYRMLVIDSIFSDRLEQ